MSDIAGPGHNQPTLADRVAELIGTCNRWTKERPVIETAEIAAIAQDYHRQLRRCRDDLDAALRGELKPLEKAMSTIRVRYRRDMELVRIAYERIGDLLTVWLVSEQDRLDKERAELRHQAEQARGHAEDALAQATVSGTVEDEHRLNEAALAAADLEDQANKAPTRAQVRGDLTDKVTSLHTYWHAEVFDARKAARAYAVDGKVQAAVQAAANRHARDAKDPAQAPDGVRFYSTE